MSRRRNRWQNDGCRCEWSHQLLHDVPLTGHPGTLGSPTVANLTELFGAWADDVCQVVEFVERHNWHDTGRVVRLTIALERVLRGALVVFGQPEPFDEEAFEPPEDLEPEEPAPAGSELIRLYLGHQSPLTTAIYATFGPTRGTST